MRVKRCAAAAVGLLLSPFSNFGVWLHALSAAALLASSAALAQTCLLTGGKFFCGAEPSGHWTVAACDEAGVFLSREAAWCQVRGGTWNGGGCVNPQPDTDGNVVQRSIQFSDIVRASTCSVTNDTGYGATYSTNFCLAGGDVYREGYLWITSRRLSISCANGTSETISIDKRRPIATGVCPPGYLLLWQNNFGWSCGRPLDCEGCQTIGNPITPLTGVKVETEVDYRHASGLQFGRHYHSFRFYEPRTFAQGRHTENRLGIAWRSEFDKRVMPIVPAHATYKHAISLPSGPAQYFDLNGVEQYNLGGPAGTLIEVPGVGYYYRGPNRTEFYRADGQLEKITERSGRTITLTYSDGTSGPNGGFAVDADGVPTSLVLPANRLIRVTDSYGNTLALGLDAGGRIITVTVPGGGQYLYRYDAQDLLTSVTFPDGKVRTYRYNEPANMIGGASLPYALTSIVDENGDLYSTFKYDTSGRAVSTERAGATQKYSMVFGASSSSVTDPLLTTRTFNSSNPDTDGVARLTGVSTFGGAGFGAGVKARTYDAAGNVASQTDFNDIKTCYAYLLGRNLETVRVEGLPAATNCAGVLADGATLPLGSRKTVTEWHARWAEPVHISEPLRRTTLTYNGDAGASCAPGTALIDDGGPSGLPIAVVCSRTVQATTDPNGAAGFGAGLAGTPRISAFTYSASGQVLTADGPRTDVSDVTTYAYATNGSVETVTNAASHVTTVTSHNPHGQPLTILDPNAVTTTLAYDARQRLKTRTVGTETTTYDYDDAGQVIKVTLPDGSFLSYDYDAAHRLTSIVDNQGNRIAYTLDAMGNRTLEEVFDPANQLAQKRSRVYSALNRLFQELGAQNQTTEYGYDDRGNVTSVKDPLNRVTTNQYDSLNRLKQVTSPVPISAVTQYAYNGLDALVQVTDPRSLSTSYTVDGLGNLTQQAGPDTGNTVSTYDDAGNLLTQTDAKGQLTTYAYDALNRVGLITFHDGSKQAYAYDQGANGIGRLCSITETDPANQQTSLTQYTYDSHGRVSTEARTVGGMQYTIAYAYDAAGRFSGIGYPSGRTVAYTFDALGRVSGITTTFNNDTQTVVSNVAYHPFGGVRSYTLGNGQVHARSYDQDGRINSYTLGAKSYSIGYDAANRIEFISEVGNPSNSNNYVHDELDRLTSAVIPGTSYGYTYDAVGNRTKKTIGVAEDTLSYNASSNRIDTLTPASGPARTFVFDPNGSTTNDGVNTYGYDVRGRMAQSVGALGTTNYQVNALGQRIRKSNSQGDTVFHYDTRGRLIAETDPAGALKRELIYLGDIPVGVAQ